MGPGFQINGVPVFCRGACWTPLDVVSLHSRKEQYRAALEQIADAGFNMVRVAGPLVYEDETFFATCDELGILVWQDFMFANMDYPFHDEAFRKLALDEASSHLTLWTAHPCVVAACGNSEVSQQAAMWGAPRELWSPSFFEEDLRSLVAEFLPGALYFPSSAQGGAFPHQASAGTVSYYGVGAYLRPLDDLRLSKLGFATECLAFANIPEPATMASMPGGSAIRVHHAEWKRRAPRDLGAGWDFEDVRDHYLQVLYAVDPLQLRYSDHDRYVELSRRVSSELMVTAFSEWRRPGSTCRGALIWFLRDLWAGAGWGIVDSNGHAKAPLFALRRILQPRWISIHDEGLNGAYVCLGNETSDPASGVLEIALFRNGHQLLSRVRSHLDIEPRSQLEVPVANLLGEFHDITRAYRFGPLECDLVVASFSEEPSGAVRSTVFLPERIRHTVRQADVQASATARSVDDGVYELTISSERFLHSVHIDAPGFIARDQYFDVLPGEARTVLLQPVGKESRRLQAWVDSLNMKSPALVGLLP